MQMITLSGGFLAKIHDPAVAEYNKRLVLTLLTPMSTDQHICSLVPGHPVIVPVGTGVHNLGECAPSPLCGVEQAVGPTLNKKIK